MFGWGIAGERVPADSVIAHADAHQLTGAHVSLGGQETGNPPIE